MKQPIKKSGNVIPTIRDMQLFEFVGRVGSASLSLLQQRYWYNKDYLPGGRKYERGAIYPSTCQDRLTKLIKAGYLKSEKTMTRGKEETYYWITPKAIKHLYQKERIDEKRRNQLSARKIASSEVAHTLDIADYIHTLQTKGILKGYRHEHELKSLKVQGKLTHAADGAVLLHTALSSHSPGMYLLERDGKYHGKMLQEKIAGYGRMSYNVIWLVRTKARYERIKREVAPFPNIHVQLFNGLQ